MTSHALSRTRTLLATAIGAATLAGALVMLSAHNRKQALRAEAAALERLFVTMGDAEDPEAELAYVERGEGETLVLLHGNGSAIEDFESSGLIEVASASHRVIAFDRPGFGASSRPDGTLWTAAHQADLIDAALARLGIDRYLVLGHSFGASVALECALRHPRRVRGLIAISGYYHPEPRPALALASTPALPFIGHFLRQTLLPVAARLAWPRVMEKLFRPAPVSPGFSKRLKELATRPSQLRAIGADSALLLAERIAMADYRKLSVPTGLLAGDGDDIINAKAEAEKLAGEISGAELVIVPGVGHMLHHSAPDAVTAMIARIAAKA